jgi:hypothetical protein
MQDGNLRSFGMILDGRLPTTSIRRCGEDATLLIVLNAHDENCPVHPRQSGCSAVATPRGGCRYACVSVCLGFTSLAEMIEPL